MGESIGRFSVVEQDRYRPRVERCLAVLDRMLRDQWFAVDEPTAGVEVELALVDDRMQPAMLNHAVLDRSVSELLTSELGSWNLEINSPPHRLSGTVGRALEHDIQDVVDRATASAAAIGARPVTIGILPTLALEHLGAGQLTDDARYALLNEQIRRRRGRPLRLDIAAPPGGTGEHLAVDLDSVAGEAACTSLQLHLQLGPDSVPAYWNAAQAVAGVQVAVAANSPFLLGHQLWAETRVPLFAQAVDTRSDDDHARNNPPRVWFGDGWTDSPLDLFDQNVRHFDTLLPLLDPDHGEDPMAAVEAGRAPELAELCLHNSTVWRWNRPVYDVADGVPHLRLENRVLPAAPTTVDAVADALFFYGLVRSLADQDRPVWHLMSFAVAESNFVEGARYGIDADQDWPGRGRVAVADLVLDELLPAAERGLAAWGVSATATADALAVIEQRCRSRRTGASWQVATVAALERAGETRPAALRRMLELYLAGTQSRRPVHTWPTA